KGGSIPSRTSSSISASSSRSCASWWTPSTTACCSPPTAPGSPCTIAASRWRWMSSARPATYFRSATAPFSPSPTAPPSGWPSTWPSRCASSWWARVSLILHGSKSKSRKAPARLRRSPWSIPTRADARRPDSSREAIHGRKDLCGLRPGQSAPAAPWLVRAPERHPPRIHHRRLAHHADAGEPDRLPLRGRGPSSRPAGELGKGGSAPQHPHRRWCHRQGPGAGPGHRAAGHLASHRRSTARHHQEVDRVVVPLSPVPGPLEVSERLASLPGLLLLDSAARGSLGRASYVMADPVQVLSGRVPADTLAA